MNTIRIVKKPAQSWRPYPRRSSPCEIDISALLLLVRHSRWPLTDPGPTHAETDIILDVALRAPDNGCLRPWRFVVIRDGARESFGDLLVELSAARDPRLPRAEHEQRKQRAFAAPLIVALGASVNLPSPIPQIEQLLSVGAAVMNMLNAVHALGYGGYWTSDPDCYEPELLEAMGLQDEHETTGCLPMASSAKDWSQPPA